MSTSSAQNAQDASESDVGAAVKRAFAEINQLCNDECVPDYNLIETVNIQAEVEVDTRRNGMSSFHIHIRLQFASTSDHPVLQSIQENTVSVSTNATAFQQGIDNAAENLARHKPDDWKLDITVAEIDAPTLESFDSSQLVVPSLDSTDLVYVHIGKTSGPDCQRPMTESIYFPAYKCSTVCTLFLATISAGSHPVVSAVSLSAVSSPLCPVAIF